MASISEICELIRRKWDCVTYARDILGLPIFKDGDRCMTPIGSGHTHNDSFWVHKDSWHDFSNNLHGDVIDMAAYCRYNGDKGRAMRDLGGEFFSSLNPTSYRQHQESLSRMIDRWHKALRPQDREYLHDRRIDDWTIDSLKIGYCGDEKSGMFDRIIIPYWRNGLPVYYAGRDCSNGWKNKSSGVSKYKKMYTRKNEYSENTMWGLDSLADDFCHDSEKGKYLCILEGMFDAMSFWQDGWHVLSPIGGRFAHKLMPFLKSVCKRFEKVFICMDNDGPGIIFQRDIAKFMFANNIPFVCGHVQETFGGGKIKDVSDYYTAGGSLAELVETAVPGIRDLAAMFHDGDEEAFREFLLTYGRYASPAELQLLKKYVRLDADYVKECLKEAKKPPLEKIVAEEVAKEHTIIYSVGDSFYEYEHGVWSPKPDEAIQLYVDERLGRFADIGRVSAVTRHMRVLKWSKAEFDRQNILNVTNGILNLDTMQLLPHSPGYLSSIQIGRFYDPKEKCPLWEKFIHDAMEGDPLKIRCARMIAGYPFVPDGRFEKGIFLMGEGSNGKSVFIETLRHVLDPRNCSNVKIADLGDRFEPLRLRHSLVNFATETQVDVKGAEPAIKAIASGEVIYAAHKGVDSVEFRPRTKLVFACNNFLRSKDVSLGFVRKMKFLTFGRIFTEQEADKDLQRKLRAEANGILNWMIAGYRDLVSNNGFVETKDEAITREQFLSLADPVAAFVRAVLGQVQGTYMSVREMYEMHYLQWQRRTHTEMCDYVEFDKRVRRLIRMLLPHVKFVHKETGNVYEFPEKEAPIPF